MLLTTIGNEKIEVERVDITFLTSYNVIGVKSLLGPSALFQLNEASATAVREAIEPGRLVLGAAERLKIVERERDELRAALRSMRERALQAQGISIADIDRALAAPAGVPA